MSKFRVTLEVEEDFYNPVPWTAEILESALRDILKVSALPAMNLNLISSTVTKKRG